ncbi:TPA: hypothetical protein ACXGDT_002452 [Klebsiella pneumoniae]|uniref:hypothetical protein n=1 Tax=Klebsiella pneumoniae TaxID=573 RepID=UPI000E2DFAAC|nr:hypothetical protein [Klebsiella pneumoniae]SVJ72258.1 phage EaA protein [Klebsiella pneumoniae]
MTTDITELAQSLKRRATSANEFGESLYVKAGDVLALAEALEKAQQVDEELCRLLPPGVEYMDPPDGGDVTPLEGVRRMVADYRQRIAELESRTVKLPEPFKLAKSSSVLTYYYADEVDAALTAAGIKVEAE